MVGTLDRGLSQACSKSHEVMAKKSTRLEPYGWFLFTHHLFIIRDARSELNMLMDVDEQFDFYYHIQIATNQGRGWHFTPRPCAIFNVSSTLCGSWSSFIIGLTLTKRPWSSMHK